MKKIYKILLGSLMSVLLVFAPVLSVSAAQDDTNTFRFSCATPSTDGNHGYIELCLKSSSGTLSGKVIAWNTYYRTTFTTDNNFQQVESLPLRVVVNSDSVQFYTVFPMGADGAGINMAYFSMNSGYNTNYSTTGNFAFTTETDSVCTIDISSSEIVGFHIYGNFSSVTSNISNSTLFYTMYNEEIVQYNQLLSIINLINTLAADNDTIISQLNTIINNTDTIESKLSSCITLLTSIDTDLDEIKSQLAAIQSSQNQNAQEIQDNADKNASEIQKNQDDNTDKALNGDSDIDSSQDTDKIDGAVGDMDSATDEALSGKSDEEIQAEVEENLDPDKIGLDFTKANRINNFFDKCLTGFGDDYKALLLLSLSLGLGAFLIGRRYG